jgi:16S rRNA A1518/A1519 N6-dimethyltransferase RsmA/KsgA/DIM1 with predicted DNA glycosylase/AP lyase activity
MFESHENYNEVNDDFFLKLIKIGFSEPRKKLSKNLVKGGFSKEKITTLFTTLEL